MALHLTYVLPAINAAGQRPPDSVKLLDDLGRYEMAALPTAAGKRPIPLRALRHQHQRVGLVSSV